MLFCFFVAFLFAFLLCLYLLYTSCTILIIIIYLKDIRMARAIGPKSFFVYAIYYTSDWTNGIAGHVDF